jgi:hypothetical protein
VTGGRLKLTLLLAGLALSGLVFLGWTQAWFSIVVVDGPTLSIGGDVAAPALSTLALTCLVLNGALSIAGPVFRVILGVLEAMLGVTVVFSGVLAIADPVKASAATISDATGVAGGESIAGLVSSAVITAWPWVATVAGALLVVIGVVVVATAGRWPGSGRKYSAVRLAAEDGGSVDDWDALSEGRDPT